MCCDWIYYGEKNQIQIVEAFAQLNEDIRENCAVFMCGRDMLEGAVKSEYLS